MFQTLKEQENNRKNQTKKKTKILTFSVCSFFQSTNDILKGSFL